MALVSSLSIANNLSQGIKQAVLPIKPTETEAFEDYQVTIFIEKLLKEIATEKITQQPFMAHFLNGELDDKNILPVAQAILSHYLSELGFDEFDLPEKTRGYLTDQFMEVVEDIKLFVGIFSEDEDLV